MEVEASGATVAPGAPDPAPEAPRRPRRGPAPIASFDHDVSDESSPETKQAFRLPEIREIPAGGDSLAAPAAGRARSHSTPAAGALGAPPAPRIDISRASSSSHHDSRDSSPELALFAGDGSDGSRQRLEAAFREDGALDLRSSTEELSFLEPAPGEPGVKPAMDPPTVTRAPPPPAPAPGERRHSRKDSQSSEAALLGISGRTSRLSSVGSQCSAMSAVSHVSHVSRLSVVSGVSRSPSPHRMLLETSFCGPKPIETDPEACAAAVAEHILEIAKLSAPDAAPPLPVPLTPAAAPTPVVDARDHREVRTEVTVEAARAPSGTDPAPRVTPAPAPPAPAPPDAVALGERTTHDRTEQRKPRPRVRRQPSEPEVYKSRNKSKDIIRIKLRPDDEDEEEEEESRPGEAARKPASLALAGSAAPAPRAPPPASPSPSRRRSPSPLGPPSVSRKSSFCSLFKSRETVGSPDSPQSQEALRRKRSLTEGRARSKSRDRSATPTATKIRGSVLSLFRTPRRSAAADSSPPSRATSPAPLASLPDPHRAAHDKLKYYEDAKNGIIHIPLRTPPEERGAGGATKRSDDAGAVPGSSSVALASSRPASAPQSRERGPPAGEGPRAASTAPPVARTVLPDGSIIIPLRSPTERAAEPSFPEPARARDPTPPEPSPLDGREPVVTDPPRAESTVTPVSSGEASVTSPGPGPGPMVSPPEPPPQEDPRRRRKERLVFTTHVGSREQVFSTQFSITKTPSVTSEISGSFPSFDGGELRDTHIAADTPGAAGGTPSAAGGGSGAVTPQDPPKDSSESEPSSETGPPQAGNDVERRGLVVQESFEEELPYVPTTLPQERSVAVPMVPVRERGGVLVRSVQRPRAGPAAGPPPGPPAPAGGPRAPLPAPPAAADKLRIKLPRRPRPPSAPALARPSRERTRSGSGPAAGGDGGGERSSERGGKQEWIDFEEVPERRKQPKRIQTLPVGAADEDGGVVFNYVEPEQCRCECHAHAASAARDDQLPLLADLNHSRISTSSAECGGEEDMPPFISELEPRHGHGHTHLEGSAARARP